MANAKKEQSLGASLYDIPVETAQGDVTNLSEYRGRTLLIVNTASRCGFTPQLEGLELLHKLYGDRGFSVLGFPCNQFLGQEPLEGDGVVEFCRTEFGVTFPVFGKVLVNGPKAHPLYAYLKRAAPGLAGLSAVKWNFTKFLVAPDGQVLKRYGPSVKPADIAADIEKVF